MNTWDLILMGIQIGYNQRKIEEEGVPQEPIRPEVIIQMAAKYYSVSWDQIISKSRKSEYVRARQVTMYLLSGFSQLTLKEIGRRIGGRDHTTVIHSRENVKDLMSSDENYRAEVKHLTRLIAEGSGLMQVQPLPRGKDVKLKLPVEPQPKRIIRFNWEREPVVNRPAAEYSNSGHLNLLKRLA
jgi:hypothetical protein